MDKKKILDALKVTFPEKQFSIDTISVNPDNHIVKEAIKLDGKVVAEYSYFTEIFIDNEELSDQNDSILLNEIINTVNKL